MDDLTTLTPEDFTALQQAVDTETTRRTLLDRIPAQVQQLAAQYVESGGDRADLTAALDAEVSSAT